MKATQKNIDAIIAAYNAATKAHKRAPVEKYVQKQLAAGETVDLSSGDVRWSSALRFFGTPEDMQVEFFVNSALPERMQAMLSPMKEQFFHFLQDIQKD